MPANTPLPARDFNSSVVRFIVWTWKFPKGLVRLFLILSLIGLIGEGFWQELAPELTHGYNRQFGRHVRGFLFSVDPPSPAPAPDSPSREDLLSPPQREPFTGRLPASASVPPSDDREGISAGELDDVEFSDSVLDALDDFARPLLEDRT